MSTCDTTSTSSMCSVRASTHNSNTNLMGELCKHIHKLDILIHYGTHSMERASKRSKHNLTTVYNREWIQNQTLIMFVGKLVFFRVFHPIYFIECYSREMSPSWTEKCSTRYDLSERIFRHHYETLNFHVVVVFKSFGTWILCCCIIHRKMKWKCKENFPSFYRFIG